MKKSLKIFLSFLLIYEPFAYWFFSNRGVCRSLLPWDFCASNARYILFMGIPVIVMAIYFIWEKQIVSLFVAEKDSQPSLVLECGENKDFFLDCFKKTLDKEGVVAEVGAAALLNTSCVTGKNTDVKFIEKYFGNLQYVEKLQKNHDLLLCKILTGKQWVKEYLERGLNAPTETQIWIVLNVKGDIIGIIAIWKKTKTSETLESEFLPGLVRRDQVDTVKTVDGVQSEFTFGKNLNSDNHPYKFEQPLKGGIIYLKELVNGRWVNTGFYDPELEGIRLEKGKITALTMAVLMEMRLRYKIIKIINKIETEN